MRARRSERGIVFVIALAVLAALVAILAATAASQRVAMKAETNRIDERRARLMAQAGIQRAITELANEAAAQQGGATTGSGTTSTQPTNATTTQDDWATLGTNGADRFIVGDSDFRLQIVDACSLIDLNTAPETQLDQLPLTSDQVDSLLDWRETSTTPRPDGAKDDYYNNLQNPYNTALRRLDTLDELMQVKGFTAQTIYTPQTNIGSTATIVQGSSDQQPTLYDLCTVASYAPMTRPSGQALINVNAGGAANTKLQRLAQAGITGNLAQRIIQVPNFASVGDICAQAGTGPQDYRLILDNLAVDNQPRKEGRINLNTASESVLDSVPDLPPDTVQAILQRQSSGFTSLGDMADIQGLNSAQGLRQFADYFTVASQTFIVRVVGEAGSFKVAQEAIVDMQNGQPKILQTSDAPFSDMPTRWRWDDATNDITLQEAQ